MPNKNHSLYSISMKSHYKNSQAMKKSEIVGKLSKTSIEDGSTKDLQLGKNKGNKEFFSPKFSKQKEKEERGREV